MKDCFPFSQSKKEVLCSYQTEFRKADERRGADPFTAAALYFVDVRERRLLAGAHHGGLTPVIGAFKGRKAAQDAHIVHTAYRAFFEMFFGMYVDADTVEGLVEELELVPVFQHGRKGYVYYVLTIKQLFSIIEYVGCSFSKTVRNTHAYTPFYERGLPRTQGQLMSLRTVGMSSRYEPLDGAAAILEDLKTKQVVTLVFVDVDEPRPIKEGGILLGMDPFLLEDLEGIRSWMNNVRYRVLRALTKVSHKVVRHFQPDRLRAVFAQTRRQVAADSIAKNYSELVYSNWFKKKLSRVAPEPVTTNSNRPPALTIEIVDKDGPEDSTG
jgi:hypothetical protein